MIERNSEGRGSLRKIGSKAKETGSLVLRKGRGPVLVFAAGVATVGIYENRQTISSTVHGEQTKVSGTLVGKPSFLAPIDEVLADGTRITSPGEIAATIKVCQETNVNNGQDCHSEKALYDESDVAGGKVKIDGNNITVDKDLVGKERPFEISRDGN